MSASTISRFQVAVSKETCVPFRKTPQTGVVACSQCQVESYAGMELHNFGAAGQLPVCPLCHASQHLQAACVQDAGVMIWLPEMSQAELNALVTVIFASVQQARGKDDGEVEHLKSLYRNLDKRTEQLVALFGQRNDVFDATSPQFMAQLIAQTSATLGLTGVSSAVISERLDGLRFLAQPKAFAAFIRGAARVLEEQFPRATWFPESTARPEQSHEAEAPPEPEEFAASLESEYPTEPGEDEHG
jgi:hypothetical protein